MKDRKTKTRAISSITRLGLVALLVVLVSSSAVLVPSRTPPHLSQRPGYAPHAAIQASTTTSIPSQFQGLYTQLNNNLQDFDRLHSAKWHHLTYRTDFAAVLLAADPQALVLTTGDYQRVWQSTMNYLSALQAIGVRTIKIDLDYPSLATNFPTYSLNLRYYSSLAQELRHRHMKLYVNSFVFISGLSRLAAGFNGLTTDSYASAKIAMLQTIIDKIKSDYLTIEDEPTNVAKLAQIPQLNDSMTYVNLLTRELTSLHRGHTLLGAGCGTWESMSFAQAVAAVAGLDYIDYHVYPLSSNYLQQVVSMIDVAKAHHKRVFIGEFWLDKVPLTNYRTVNSLITQIAVAAYSFWQPLDETFIKIMAKVALYEKVDVLCAFWDKYFFAYVNYNDAPNATADTASAAYVTQLETMQVAQNVRSKSLTAVGQLYRDIIAHKVTF